MKKALITGIFGQDGAYLAKFLLNQGYEVTGGTRRSGSDDGERLKRLEIKDHVKIINFDLTDQYQCFDIIKQEQFDEIYNLAAQSFVGASWDLPIQTSMVDAIGPLFVLDAIRRFSTHTRFYQASTSEMFGKIQDKIQNEETKLYPRSPYGVAKQFAHSMTINYRESFDLFACSGILFNHESPLRGSEFVTKKITEQVAHYHKFGQSNLRLGNIYSKRDWGFAAEYVEGMWKILNSTTPDDFVLATGTTHTIKEFIEFSFRAIDVEIEWSGEGADEIGRNVKTGDNLVSIDPRLYRPAEVDVLIGDSSKVRNQLGWIAKTGARRLAEIMVHADIALLNGYKVLRD